MINLTKYRSDLKSEYIRVGVKYYRFIEYPLFDKSIAMELRPWHIRIMKSDEVDFDEVPKYDAFHHESNSNYPHLFSLEGFVKTYDRSRTGNKTPVKVYRWVGIEPKSGK